MAGFCLSMKILLLDCDKKLEKALLDKGYKVASGTLGFDNGKRVIPHALYEQDVIVFNPTSATFVEHREVKKENDNLYFPSIGQLTPEVRKTDMDDFFERGGVCLIFYNDLLQNRFKEWAVYRWLINTFVPSPTNDRDTENVMFPDDEEYTPFKSLLRDFKPKLPVKRKLDNTDQFTYPRTLIRNKRSDVLAAFHKYKDGMVIGLPTYDNNNEVIVHFLTHVYPRLYEITPELPSILDVKKSSKQLELEAQIAEAKKSIEESEKKIEDINASLIEETQRVERVVGSDETGRVIMGYLDDILADKNEAWFPAYKITERLFKHYGGEKEANAALGMGKEITFIRRIANEGYRDTRHAPKVNEVIKPPTPEESKQGVEYSIALVKKYLESLI